jgi:hypothetical protein
MTQAFLPLLPLIGMAAGAIATGVTNRNNKRYAQQQYQQQRADSLSDWNMQNEYNSPEQQMKRFQDAGLNPNLIYGQQTTAQPVRPSQKPDYEAKPINTDTAQIQQSIFQHQQIEQIQQQIENQKTRNLLDKAKIVTEGLKAFGMEVDNKTKSELQETTVEQGKASLQKTFMDIISEFDSNSRANEMQPGNLKEQEQKINSITQSVLQTISQTENIKQNTKNLKAAYQSIIADTRLKKLEIKMREDGTSFNDELWQRTLTDVIKDYLPDLTPEQVKGAVRETLPKIQEASKKGIKWWLFPIPSALGWIN